MSEEEDDEETKRLLQEIRMLQQNREAEEEEVAGGDSIEIVEDSHRRGGSTIGQSPVKKSSQDSNGLAAGGKKKRMVKEMQKRSAEQEIEQRDNLKKQRQESDKASRVQKKTTTAHPEEVSTDKRRLGVGLALKKRSSSKKITPEEQGKEDERLRNLEISVDQMLDDMAAAAEKDKVAFKANRPALNKLLLSKQLQENLKNLEFQEKFLYKGGCDYIAEWLDTMEDGTYPNINLVQGLLECLDRLNISNEILKDSDILKVIKQYKADTEKGVSPIARRLAIQLNDRWDRQIQGGAAYDEEEDHTEGYRLF